MIHRMDDAPPDFAPFPKLVEPMLATAGTLPKRDDGWAYELKWDGVRAIVYVDGGRVRVRSRNDKDLLDVLPRAPRARLLPRLDERGPRRRDRRARRVRAAGLRQAPATPPRRVAVGGREEGAGVAGELPRLRRAVPRRAARRSSSPTTSGAASSRRSSSPAGPFAAPPSFVDVAGADVLASLGRAGPRGRGREAPGLAVLAGTAHRASGSR